MGKAGKRFQTHLQSFKHILHKDTSIGLLPSGSGCILDLWLTRKTGNIANIYNRELVTQVRGAATPGEVRLAGSHYQPPGWRGKSNFSRGPGAGLRRQKWSCAGSVL